MARKTREDTELTRKRILDAGLKIFADVGYASARIEDIAKEAGVTRGGVYWHFANKLELFKAIFEHYQSALDIRLAEIFSSEMNPSQKLRCLAEMFIDWLTERGEHREIELLALGLSRDGCVKQTEIADARKRDVENFLNYIIEIIEEGKRVGEIRKDISSDAISRGICSYLLGMDFAWLKYDSLFDLKKNKDTLVSIMLSGISPVRG